MVSLMASRPSAPSWWCSTDSHGDVKILDGYCRHMGSDLTQGTIKGDEMACPFHDWRWGGDGQVQAGAVC